MHGIMEFDKGYVNGSSTWHGLPQYVCIPERMVSIEEALEVSDYPLEKIRLHREDGVAVDAWALVRTDVGATLVPAVGDRFSLVSNKRMVNVVNEHLLSLYPDLKIESVGTLFNGATFFLNLRVHEFQTKGDRSSTLTNLLYCNPLGRGSYVACAHNTRIVCNNTERVAEAQGIANQSLKKFRHTSSATEKINNHLIEIAELKLELQRHEEKLNFLATQEVSIKEVDDFLDKLFPLPKKDGRQKTIAINSRESYLNIFGGVQRETLSNPNTKYGLYCAFTDWVDHVKTSRNSDDASIMYDGLLGNRADKKQQLLDSLVAA